MTSNLGTARAPGSLGRKHATRITTALTELSTRRESEATQREAEDRVTEARAALEKAERELRAVKASPAVRPPSRPLRSTPTISDAYSRDELTAIQAWAREHGHQVADRGLPSKTVLDAYAAAHPATPARKAG